MTARFRKAMQADLFTTRPPVVAPPRPDKPRIVQPVLEVSEDERYWLAEARQGVDTEREDCSAFRCLHAIGYVDRISERERDVWKITALGQLALRAP